jgi:serine/threonine-protein kinase
MAIQLGDTIADRYRIDGRLGEGGMGVVFSATHAVTRKHVALKVLRPDYAADSHARQRFLREARAACAVRHPNVVQIHDVIEIADG